MARRPSGTRRPIPPRSRGGGPAAAPPAGDEGAASPRERITSAFLALVAEKPFETIGMAEIAERANVSLAELRDEFSSTFAIYAAHMKSVDRRVLSGSSEDMEEESPHERLFDVLMRRLDVLAPHKAVVRSLLRSTRRNPPLALALNRMAVRSQQWMLTAAGIDAAGPRGMMRAQGSALLFARVLRVWLDDEDPGLARTMAALDRALGRGARLAGLLDEVCRFVPPRCPSLRRRRREDYEEDSGDAAAAV